MKKIIIYTISDINNYGNRLQNYALAKKYEQLNLDVVTFWEEKTLKVKIKKFVKNKLMLIKGEVALVKANKKRKENFIEFNKNIKFVKGYKFNEYNNKFDFYSIGSDQVWNYNFKEMNEDDFLLFAESNKCIGYAPSFGVSKVDKKNEQLFTKGLNHIKHLSVREDAGLEIIKKLTKREDATVVVDPTMLLTKEEWKKVSKKPEQLKKEKFILNYFLGELSEKRTNEINKIAEKNKWKVINILDKNDPFYTCGPAEFLYLEEHAELICTDSFHSSVFGIIFNTPFMIFDREDKTEKMNSRIDTLLTKFNLLDRKYNNELTEKHLSLDFKHANKLLEEVRKNGIEFIEKSTK